ncbi:MAG TPA: glycoside hydrolase family 3 N-terminal domain-containing protein [Pyrinomonadaceae bacterium]|nr:glycoside hydrolase family 3 N-terminal domain-containing protein [Pyrinomonadaceae bacterium]
MTKKISRRDFMGATAAAGAATLVAPSLLGAFEAEAADAAQRRAVASPRPLTSFDPQAREVLGRMTLEEKVGQMTQPEQDALKELDDIRNYSVGSLLSGGNSDPKRGDAADNSLQAWTDMYDRYQQVAMRSRLGIPILYGVDAVHGHNNVIGAVVFPHNIGLGCTRDARLVERAARVTAEEVRATGIQWTFAPCVTVPRDERWGRTYEGFSESPDLAAALGAAAVRGFQRGDLSHPLSVLACAKHYVGDGGTLMGTGTFGVAEGKKPLLDQGDTRMSERELRRIHMPGYPSTIREGVGSIMPSYSSWNGTKVSGHKYLMTDVLKREMGFDGFLISDYNAIDQITKDYKQAIAVSINAGMDMVMVPQRYREFFDLLVANVKEGAVAQSRIDDAVMRILRVKFAMGMMDKGRSQLADRSLHNTFGSAAHRQAARECVRASLVLLKNSRRALPLRKTARHIHVAGRSADDIGNQCGGWTVTWQGQSGGVTTGGTTILQAIQTTVSRGTRVTFSKDGRDAAGADVGVVVIGETPYAEGVGDREDLSLAAEDVAAVDNLKRAGLRVVAVLVTGRPLILEPILAKCDAVVAAWLPGTEGQGVADVLFGDYRPTGKLSFSWPRTNAQIPVNVGDRRYNPLFRYGYGLSF